MPDLTQCQRDILDFLMSTEILASVDNISERFSIPHSAAKKDLRILVEKGYVSELGEGDEDKYYRSSGRPAD